MSTEPNPAENSSPKSTFLIMKLVAMALMICVLAVLIYNSKLHDLIFASTERSRIPDLGPAVARPTALPIPLPGQKPQPQGASQMPTLQDQPQKGLVYHLVFWAQWCEPCTRELPMIEKMIQANSVAGYRVVLINVDTENFDVARQMQAALAPSATSIFDKTQEIKMKYNVTALPYHVLVDKRGRTASAFFADISKHKEKFKSLLHQLLAEEVQPE